MNLVLNPTHLHAIREQLAVLGPVAVYLFGSVATGDCRPDSDIDLGILPRVPVEPVLGFKVQTALTEALNADVDLVDLSRASTVMRKEVIEHGKLLYETDPARRMEFEMYALSDYARLNEERAPVLAALANQERAEERASGTRPGAPDRSRTRPQTALSSGRGPG